MCLLQLCSCPPPCTKICQLTLVLTCLQSASARCRVPLPQAASKLSQPQLLSVRPQIGLAQLRQQRHSKMPRQPGRSQACPSQPMSHSCPSRQGWRWPGSSSVPSALASRQRQPVLVRGRGVQQRLAAPLAQARSKSQQQQLLLMVVVLHHTSYLTQSPRMPLRAQARALLGCQINDTAGLCLLSQISVPHSFRLTEVRTLMRTMCSRRWRGVGQTWARSLRHSQRALCSLSMTLLLLLAVRTSRRGVLRRGSFRLAVHNISSSPVQGGSQQPLLSLLAMLTAMQSDPVGTAARNSNPAAPAGVPTNSVTGTSSPPTAPAGAPARATMLTTYTCPKRRLSGQSPVAAQPAGQVPAAGGLQEAAAAAGSDGVPGQGAVPRQGPAKRAKSVSPAGDGGQAQAAGTTRRGPSDTEVQVSMLQLGWHWSPLCLHAAGGTG